MAYLADLQTDLDTSIVTECDPRAFLAKARKKDKDSPTYNEAIRSAEVDEWIAAMKKEVKQLMQINTWKIVSRTDIHRLQNGRQKV